MIARFCWWTFCRARHPAWFRMALHEKAAPRHQRRIRLPHPHVHEEPGHLGFCPSGVRAGLVADFSEEHALAVISQPELETVIDLHMGEVSAEAYGCDLTYDYVKINADYRS